MAGSDGAVTAAIDPRKVYVTAHCRQRINERWGPIDSVRDAEVLLSKTVEVPNKVVSAVCGIAGPQKGWNNHARFLVTHDLRGAFVVAESHLLPGGYPFTAVTFICFDSKGQQGLLKTLMIELGLKTPP